MPAERILLLILLLVTLNGITPAQEPQRLDLVVQTGHTHSPTSVALSGEGQVFNSQAVGTLRELKRASIFRRQGDSP